MSTLIRKMSFDKANAKIRALGEVLKRPMRDVLESGAHVAAISCAKSSQPFGTGEEAKAKGEGRVMKDIAKVYRTAGGAWKSISNPGEAAGFWKAYKAGEFESAQNILAKSGSIYSGVPLQPFDEGAAHKAARSGSTGRVTISSPKAIVVDPENLKAYVERKKKNVGFGKGGWADVARVISGSARGLKEKGDISARWILRHAHGLGRAREGGTETHPTITITSLVSYAEHILQGGARTDAIQIARDRMIKNLRIAVEAEAKRLK